MISGIAAHIPDEPKPQAVAVPSSDWLGDPGLLVALTAMKRRSLDLALEISRSIGELGYHCTPITELEIANRISNHILALEWPAAAKFCAERYSPNNKVSERAGARSSDSK